MFSKLIIEFQKRYQVNRSLSPSQSGDCSIDDGKANSITNCRKTPEPIDKFKPAELTATFFVSGSSVWLIAGLCMQVLGRLEELVKTDQHARPIPNPDPDA